MPTFNYPAESTALLLLDPYNDFLSEGGKLWPFVKEVAEKVGLLDNLRSCVSKARESNLQLFIVPHHRAKPSDYSSWKYPNFTQLATLKSQTFAEGTWGGEWHPDFAPKGNDIVIKEHWAQSGFPNTDLDFLLKQHGIQKVVLIGMLANTCVESTGRFAMELGYHVTLIKDATAAMKMEMMHAAHELNGPTFAHAILTTKEWTDAVSATSAAAVA